MGLLKKKEKIVYVLDIGSASVGGSILKLEKGSTPKTLLQVRKDLPLQEDLNFNRFLSATTKGIADVIKELKKSSHNKPDETHTFLSSPWFTAQNRTVVFRQWSEFKVTQKLIDELVVEETNMFKDKISQDGKHQMVTLEANIIDIALNGYETLEPYGKKAKELKVTFFISISTKQVFEAFRNAIVSELHDDEITFYTFPFAVFSSLSEIAVTPDNFMFADINGEMTDVITVRNGMLVETFTFPLGRNFIRRKIAEKMSVPANSVFPMIDLYNKGKIEEGLKMKMAEAIFSIGKEWIDELSKSLDASSFEHLLPNHFYVLTDLVLEPVFVNFLKSESLSRFVGSEQKFIPTAITPALLGSKTEGSPKASSDVFLLLEAVFLQKLFDVQ